MSFKKDSFTFNITFIECSTSINYFMQHHIFHFFQQHKPHHAVKNLVDDARVVVNDTKDSNVLDVIITIEPSYRAWAEHIEPQAIAYFKKQNPKMLIRILWVQHAQTPRHSADEGTFQASSASSPSVHDQSKSLNVKNIIAIGSGKGGVGKSTLSLNIALALRPYVKSIGLLDADIYGPSMHHMLHLNKLPETDGSLMQPFEVYGLRCMSMGAMLDENQAAIWRGPMLQSALKQMIFKVDWGHLDLLIIDLPPGTGDVALSLAQMVTVSKAIVVCTAQDLARIDARRAINMFQRLNIPILGVIENMHGLICQHCHAHNTLFSSQTHIQDECLQTNISFLGRIPFMQQLHADEPFILQFPHHAVCKTFDDISRRILAQLS